MFKNISILDKAKRWTIIVNDSYDLDQFSAVIQNYKTDWLNCIIDPLHCPPSFDQIHLLEQLGQSFAHSSRASAITTFTARP